MQFSSWQNNSGGSSLPPASEPPTPVPINYSQGSGYDFQTPSVNPAGVMVFLNGQKLRYNESYTIDETTLLFTPEFLAQIQIDNQDTVEVIWQ